MNGELPIFETFLSFQGEGVHMGRSAFFIRTHGCPLHCPWCDSAGTWHKDWIPKDVAKLTPQALLSQILEGPRPEFVVITGGEPAIHDLIPLTRDLHAHGLEVHLETSGAFHLKGLFDWITVSPKRAKMPLPSTIFSADEFKFIIEQPSDISFYFQSLMDFKPILDEKVIWLHPEWTHRQDPVVLGAITDAVKEGEGRFRAGCQMHKLYRADCRDTRSRDMVPLGGNLQKGY